jgi:2-aminoethylphosphonate-pyruvate transaminase
MRVKEKMLRDLASGGAEMVESLKWSRSYLVELCHGQGAYTAIPLQGSGTYATEAVIATIVPRDGKLLIHTNGVYGDRLVDICKGIGMPFRSFRTAPFTPPTKAELERELMADAAITHVAVVHCETSTGVLNPLEPVAELCRRYGKGLIIDAIASFGAFEIDARTLKFDAVIISANKCLQAAPGISWVVVRKNVLEESKGNCHSVSLDLYDQLQYLDRTNQFRFTPPTHVIAAFAEALREHKDEGGTLARQARYRASWQRLVGGMRQMGFQTLLDDAVASPIVATFHDPDDPAYSFQKLYDGMLARGFIIFPGRLAAANTFRVACIGIVTPEDIGRAMDALAEVMAEMGVRNFGRHQPIAAE